MTTPEDPWNQQPSYPPAPGGYPSSPSSYPPAGGYPPAQGGYPPAQGGYPSQGGYPPSQGGYPPSQGYPPAQGGYPPSQGGFPPYPPPAPSYEPPTTAYPGGYPPQVPQGLTPPPGGPLPGPRKKSPAGKIAGFATTAVIVVVVVVLKVAGASFLSGVFDGDSGPNAPNDPWDGTPAASFAFGEESLVMPAPTAVGPFTVEEVTTALNTVKQALVAGRLDEKMLVDHDTSTFAALLSDFGRDDLDVLINDDKVGPAVLTWIAPGYSLVENGVRFKGEVIVSDDVLDNGIPVLVIESNFVWVYAFTGELKSPGDHLVTIKDRVSWTFPAAAEVDDQYIGMFIGAAEYSATGIDCDLMEQDLIAIGELVDVAPGQDVGDPDDAYDPDASMDIPDALAC